MTTPPRPATPVPTIPPPDEHSPGLLKRLEGWKALLGAAVAVAGAGALYAGLATHADVDQVRAGVAAQLGAVQAEQQELRVRQAVVESGLERLGNSLGGDLDKLDSKLERMGDQLLEVAKAVGARQVQPAPTPAPHESGGEP
jgi:hypothetical protein